MSDCDSDPETLRGPYKTGRSFPYRNLSPPAPAVDEDPLKWYMKMPLNCPTDNAFIKNPVVRKFNTARNVFIGGLLLIVALITLMAGILEMNEFSGNFIAFMVCASLAGWYLAVVACAHRFPQM